MKNTTQRSQHRRGVLSAAVLAAMGCASAQAAEFEFGDGWKGNGSLTVSASSSWRAEAQDSKLFSPADGAVVGKTGGTGGSNTDGGNLNYDKGANFSRLFKAISELSAAKGSSGGLLRVKGWYDDALSTSKVDFGNQANRYQRGTPLSDEGFEREQKFFGVKLLDAYGYTQFDVGGKPLQVRLGNQVVNWGESLFIQGLNQTNPLDVVALRQAGTEIKEVLSPVPMIYANLGLGGGVSVEGFYQFKWDNTSIDGCGTYWSVTETIISTNPGACTMATALSGSNPQAFLTTGANFPLFKGKDARNSGQFGLALRFPVEKLDTEFGLYYQQLHSRTPIVSGRTGAWGPVPAGAARQGLINPISAYAALGATPAGAFWEYPEKIKIAGASASTNLAGWSLGAEVSYSKDVPVQRNGNYLLAALARGIGPFGAESIALTATGAGKDFKGYDRFNKTQLQFNGVKVISGVLGAQQAILVGEVGFQSVNLPENSTARYGRGFIFGLGPAALGVNCAAGNVNVAGCADDGYFTKNSSGIRLRGQFEYSNVFDSGLTAFPTLFYGRDLSGTSIDSQFNKGRQTLGLGLRLAYQKQLNLDLNYVTYSNSAKYDPLHDRDFYSIGMNYTF